MFLTVLRNNITPLFKQIKRFSFVQQDQRLGLFLQICVILFFKKAPLVFQESPVYYISTKRKEPQHD